jgi:hypothetical protein
MRLRVWPAAGACLIAAVLAAAGCSAAPAKHPSVDNCRLYGVQAISRHFMVHAVPAACAGLSRAQVNQAVQAAIHQAVGPQPKAAGRRLAVADGRYLAPLIRAIPPPAAESPGTGGGAASAPSTLVVLAALACWLLTAAAGAYLLARSRLLGRSRAARPPAVVIGHAVLAVAGLSTWIGFAITGAAWVAWLAVGVITSVAGLGIATLMGGLPEPEHGRPVPARTAAWRAHVPAIAAHGILATVTITLVVLAATSG